MKKYGYHTGVSDALEKYVKMVSIGFIFSILDIIFGLIIFITNFRSDSLLTILFMFTLGILGVIIMSVSRRRVDARLQNLQRSWLEIHDTHICGVFCKNIAQPSSTEYFEVPISQVRRAEPFDINVVAKNTEHTILIHAVNGSYKLCINSARDAAQTIEQLMQGQASIPTHQQQPPYQHPQAYQQPTYQQQSQNQPSETYQQPVVQPPYSCGKCGAPGPFNGSCPHCGSSIKIYHH